MLDELAREIRDAAWPRALGCALEAWRTTRSPVLADLIDRLAARCGPAEPVPTRGAQRWWMQRARTYDPVTATVLLADAAELAPRTGIERKLFDRLAVLATWPDDPRVARVLAAWFAGANIGWTYAHDEATVGFYEQLAAQLVRLRDARAIATLERVLAEPRGLTVGLRERQRELAGHAIDVLADVLLDAPLPDGAAGEIARWCPSPAPPPAAPDERALWLAAADSADARLVLADYLLERGDRRGEIITLACAGGEDRARRATALLHEHWERWLGDLALVLDRGNCTFTGGVLAIATVGLYTTPVWAYAKVASHRELATIHTVRPGWNASEPGYLAFVDALPRLPGRIRLTATMIEPFARTRPRWPMRALELVTNLPDLRAPLAHVAELAAAALPDVEEIELPQPGDLDERVLAVIPALPRLFPRLARVRIDASRWLPGELRTALDALAAGAAGAAGAGCVVEVDHGHYRPR